MRLIIIVLLLIISSFFLAKVPFPLTLRFKAMLQRGIELTSLDASWWFDYFLLFFISIFINLL